MPRQSDSHPRAFAGTRSIQRRRYAGRRCNKIARLSLTPHAAALVPSAAVSFELIRLN
jgi:hypothetical protein